MTTRRIRVCVVSSLYHPNLGGLGRQAQLLSERLREEGLELFVISRKMSGMPPAPFSPDVQVIRVPVPFSNILILEEISLRNILISISFSIGCIAALIRHRNRYDIAHFHGASIPLFLSLPFLKSMGKKVVAKVAAANLGTEAGSLSGRYCGIGNALARLTRKVDAFVAISEEIRKGLLRDGVRPERIHRIANFIDTSIFYPPGPGEKERRKSELGYGGNTLVLFAGRLVPRKGVEYLLEAWRRVQQDDPGARLLILGEGPLREKLEAMAANLGISGSTCFAGGVDNVPDYLRAADIFVLPSLQEGMPNSLLEAMASGLPVVATRIGGVSDIVQHGVNGWTVPPENSELMASIVRTLICRPEMRDRGGSAAIESVRSFFSLASRLETYRRLYGDHCRTDQG